MDFFRLSVHLFTGTNFINRDVALKRKFYEGLSGCVYGGLKSPKTASFPFDASMV